MVEEKLHDPFYDPERRVACPKPGCGLLVGVQFGRLNKHAITGRSPVGKDGYCLGSGLLVDWKTT